MNLTLAYSPCPNDTFIFNSIANGTLRLPGHSITTSLLDIESLNSSAVAGIYDITKMSFHCMLQVADQYELLSVGAAVGYGCGPLLVAKKIGVLDDSSTCRVAVPGELTTANMLLKLYAPDLRSKTFMRYDHILPALLRDEVDCGVIIHETRFLYEQYGLELIVDLGRWWETTTVCPVPLGCLAIKKELAADLAEPFEHLVRESVGKARSNPAAALPYIKQHARELDEEVLSRHIATFVNDFSLELGEDGRRAVEKLRELSAGLTGNQ